MKKKALAVISFGTTYPDALEAIEKVERRLHAERPEYELFRAFTSGMVTRKLKKEQAVAVEAPDELLNRLAAEGYSEVLCQPTHVISGVEYDKMRAQLQRQAGSFAEIRLGRPLLTGAPDYAASCRAVRNSMPPLAEDEALVLMGHGTGHFANAAYSQLENTFRAEGCERVYVGTVEGFPDLGYVLGRLQKHRVSRVRLLPFMIVAGDHAQNDLAGTGEASWKTQLERAGYRTEALLRGLGSLDEIGDLFAAHLREAERL